ncbi:MAG: LysR family transcriptional regulator [Brevirhabdus sp.]
MSLDFRQLQVFEALARHGSITRAAEELRVTQPAVSIQLRKIEEQTGLALVERSGRKLQLTEAGEELRRHAERVSRDLADLDESLLLYRGVRRGRLRLAVVSTANYFLHTHLTAFKSHFPDIEVNLKVANRDKILKALESNRADLSITGQPPDDADVVARRFMDNPLVVIAPPDHPLASKNEVTLEQFSKEPLVVREPGSGTRAAMERVLGEHGLTYRASCTLSTNSAVKQAVRSGLGLAVISGQTAELEMETNRLVTLNVQGFPVVRQWYVVYRKFNRLPPTALAFRNILLSDGDPNKSG